MSTPQPPPAAELISNALVKIKKLAGTRGKHAHIAQDCQQLLDNLPEVLSPGYAAKAATAIAARTPPAAAPAAAGEDKEQSAAGPQDADPAAADPAAAAGDEGASSAGPQDGDAAAASAAEDAAAAAAGKLSADAARLAAVAAEEEGRLVGARTDAALSQAALVTLMAVLEAAVATRKANIMEVTLDLINKLIAYRYLQGVAHHVHLDRAENGEGGSASKQPPAAAAGTSSGGAAASPAPSAPLTPQEQAVQLICRCDEAYEEALEVLILRGLLTAATSITFTLHGQALLLAVRTCYNIHLMSRSEVNQTTAKATLTQMLNVVFQRMEADSVLVAVKPIVVADMLGLTNARTASPADGMVSAVQGFLNSVVSVAGYSQQPTPEQVKLSVAEAMSRRDSVGSQDGSESSVGSELGEDGERFQLALEAAAAAAGSSTAAGEEASSGKAAGEAGSRDGSGGGAAGAGDAKPGAGKGSSGSSQAPRHGSGGGGHHHHHGSSTSLLLKDAFLVFRALCKLSIRTSDSVTVADPTAVRGKLLALELLKVVLENSGPTFHSSEKFTVAIRQHLCLSLLKNCASSIPAALQLSASIFLSLMQRFRGVLKAEVGVFFPMIILKVLEPPAAGSAGAGAAGQQSIAINSYAYKVVVLRCLREACSEGQLLVDLFVNYDCDLNSSNLFERLINGLVKLAQSQLPQGAEYTALQQEAWLRQEALQCLSSAAEALLKWYCKHSGQLGSGEDTKPADTAGEQEPGLTRPASQAVLAAPSSPGPNSTKAPATPPSPMDADAVAAAVGMALDTRAAAAGGGGDALSKKRAYKEKFQEGVAIFNAKPKKGIAFLQAEGMLGPAPEDIASFLAKTDGLNKTLIGDYLGEREDMALKVMHAYVDAMGFEGMEFDSAIRTFLQGFRLPGEAQKIDRLMEKFAERFVKCNPGSFKSADVAYVLAYSVIMLNTDAHNPQVKNKMSCEGFLKNNRGINDGQDLPPDFMRALYERIVNNEIKMKDDLMAGDSSKEAEAAQRGNLLMNALLTIVGQQKQQVSAEPSDEAIKRTLDNLHEVAKGATYFTATEPDTVRPMLELIWAPLLGCFSLLFDEYHDPRLLAICLSGFAAATCLAAQLGVAQLRDVYVNSLCNFTHLHSPATMKYKNGLAFKYLLKVAQQVGNHLGDRWLEVLRCISRWELLQQIASGMPTDAVLFAGQQDKGLGRAAAALKDQLRQLRVHMAPVPGTGGIAGTGQQSMESLAMSEVSIKKAHIGASGKEEEHVIPQDIINSVDTGDMNKVYILSSTLGSDAIVSFVRSLAAISLEELRDASAPRVFSLTKIVEISHFNMNRIRLVWSRIWAVLSEYFIKVGCHANLGVAMYAVDSLRQLAMKFLERDELANYTFQNDFLRPFVVVMRQSQAVSIRELVIRCLNQMVQARVTNIKSGWKSMFMVFTTAAGDSDPAVVTLAFDTIEKIVREHFGYITETETTTFTDCVNCLIAFTNNPHSLQVALNSIAFLRFCASRLAEGAIGELNCALPEGVGVDKVMPIRMVALDSAGLPRTSSASQPPTTSTSSSSSQQQQQQAPRPSAPQQQQQQQQPGGQQQQQPALRFVDRDEHVYFWFPLLAGLSELTFDPRREVRHGALEVLFDTLRYHGGAFEPAFWARIFDSVLLPIFDHVRAEVTDTTTFTSEKRRAQEDAWLYETCTRCLQHLVDLFDQFWDLVGPLFGRLLQLLASFISRSHASLASVGVAALTRAVEGCGPKMSDDTWQEVMAMLHQVARDTLPDAWELLTPPRRGSMLSPEGGVTPSAVTPSPSGAQGAPLSPLRPALSSGSSVSSTPAAAAASPSKAGAGLPSVVSGGTPAGGQQAVSSGAALPGQLRPPYTLREGVGMRRLVKFKVQASAQLLLVQAVAEMYAGQHRHMPPPVMRQLCDVLALISAHARDINTDAGLRKRLAAQQAEDRVPEDKALGDPPLLRQETEGCHAYLSVLLHLASCSALGCSGSQGAAWPAAAAAAAECQAQQRLLDLAFTVLKRFGEGQAPNSSAAAAADTLAVPGGVPRAGAGAAAATATAAGGSGRAAAAAAAGAAASGGTASSTWSESLGFAPLVVSTLKALDGLGPEVFKAQVARFFPVLIRLIQCDYAPSDVQRALSDLFLHRVGPLIGVE